MGGEGLGWFRRIEGGVSRCTTLIGRVWLVPCLGCWEAFGSGGHSLLIASVCEGMINECPREERGTSIANSLRRSLKIPDPPWTGLWIRTFLIGTLCILRAALSSFAVRVRLWFFGFEERNAGVAVGSPILECWRGALSRMSTLGRRCWS